MNSVRSVFCNKKVLVTGHTGFKGTWLSRIMLYCGADVSGFSLPPEGNEILFLSTGTEKDVRNIYADIRNTESVKKAIDEISPDYIFHLAAQPIVRLGYEDPLLTYTTNILGTLNLLDALKNKVYPVSVVNVTTDKVYKNKKDNTGFSEEDSLNGYDPYANSKSCSDLITQTYKRCYFSLDSGSDPVVSCVRAGNVIGGGDFGIDRLFPDCMRAFHENKPVILRHPDAVRPYQYVNDVLVAYIMIAALQAEDPSKAGEYNIGPNGTTLCSTEKLAGLAAETWGNGAGMICPERPEMFHENKMLTLDNSKFTAVFGEKPETDLPKAVKDTVFWYKNFFGGEDMRLLTDWQIKEYFKENRI